MDGPSTPPEPCAVVTGRVRDAAGLPVPGARVVALEEGPRFLVFVSPFHRVALGRTDRDGRFRLELSAGPSLLVAHVRGADALGGGPGGDAHARRVVLKPGDALADLDLRLPHAIADLGTVEGRVLEEDGTPVAGRRVRVEGCSLDGPCSTAETPTDGDGAFRLEGLLPGRTRILVRGDRVRAPLRSTLDLPPGGAVRIDLILRRRPRRGTHHLDIRCEDRDGRGLDGIEVLLHDFEEFEERCTTGPGGEVRIEGLPDRLKEEPLWASVQVPGWEPAEEGTTGGPFEEHEDSLVLQLKRATPVEPRSGRPCLRFPRARPRAAPPGPDAPLFGRVVDADGTAVPGANVFWAGTEPGVGPLRRLLTGKASSPSNRVEEHWIGCTDADGGFRIRGLPPGRCLLVASLSRGIREPGMEGAMPLEIPAGRGVAGVVLRVPERMADTAILACRVVDGDGLPCDGARLQAEGAFLGLGEDLTDAFGSVEIRVWSGRTVVTAVGGGTEGSAREELEVRPGERRSVILRMQPRRPAGSLSLRVRVVDGEGRPVPGAVVGIHGEGEGGRFQATGADGVLERDGLPESFRESPPRVSAVALGYRVPGSEGSGRFPGWSPEGRAEVTVVLHRLARVQVRVVDDGTGEPVPGLNIEVWRLGGARGQASGGNFTEGLTTWLSPHSFDLEPGKVVFRAHAPGYEPGELPIEIRGPDDGTSLEMRLRRIGG